MIWLKPHGIIVLKIPARDSVYGFVTRVTPFWFHVFYKRYLRGLPNAGKPGYGPCPTVHEPIIAHGNLRRFAQAHALHVNEVCGYGTLPRLQQLFTQACSVLSLGHLAGDHYNLLFIAERRDNTNAATGPQSAGDDG